MLTHPGTLLGHGALLVPHPSVWLETVNVKSWSINDPHSMVMWVKFGSKPPTFSEVFTNTVLLIVLAFLRGSDGFAVEASRGPSPFWKDGGRKRANAVPAEPFVLRYGKINLTISIPDLYPRQEVQGERGMEENTWTGARPVSNDSGRFLKTIFDPNKYFPDEKLVHWSACI